MKIGDYLIIALLLLLSIFTWIFGLTLKLGNTAIISSDGQQVATLSLKQDRQINISGPLGESKIKVTRGFIQMTSSPCPHQICVKMGKISKCNSMIVCVPNRILIRIPCNNSDHLDAITQ
ncbi:NusG domain II-containing protein [bacterium]